MAEEEKEEIPSYVVPPSRKPSFLNSSLLVGLLAGALTGIPFAPLIGAGIGSYIGKKKMDDEEAKGKEVTAPSMWNKGTFIGGALGVMGANSIIGMTALTLGTGGLGFVGIALIGTLSIVGAWVGGKINYNAREKEYASAQEYAHFNGDYSPEKAAEQGVAPALQPELAQTPQQGMANGTSVSTTQPLPSPASVAGALPPQQFAGLKGFAAQGRAMAETEPPAEMSMADKVLAAQGNNSLLKQR